MCEVHLFAVLELIITWKCNGKTYGFGSDFSVSYSNFWHTQ